LNLVDRQKLASHMTQSSPAVFSCHLCGIEYKATHHLNQHYAQHYKAQLVETMANPESGIRLQRYFAYCTRGIEKTAIHLDPSLGSKGIKISFKIISTGGLVVSSPHATEIESRQYVQIV
jgi:hypothetical protein